MSLLLPPSLQTIKFVSILRSWAASAVRGRQQTLGVYYVFQMETYNELLKQFHESTAPTDFLPHYKSLLDEIQLGRTRRKHQLKVKMGEARQLRHENAPNLTLSSACLSIMEDSQVACSRLEAEGAGQRQLKREEEELKKELESLKIKINQINGELNLYRNREPTVRQTNIGNSLTVLRQWKQVEHEAAIIERQEFRQQQILHDLKARKEQLAEEIQRLIKDKQANDQLIKRWRRSKLARAHTPKEPKGEPDLQYILRTFHLLAGLAEEYERNTGVSAEELKEKYECEEFKGGRGQILKFYLQKGPFFDQAAAKKIVEFYCKLELELDRNERAHQQATETLNTLQTSHEQLNTSLRKIHQNKEKSTIHALRKYSQDILVLEEKLNNTCGRIARLATALYELLRRVSCFFKGVERVMGQSEAGRRLMRELPDSTVIARFEELLFRNPEEYIQQWTNHQLLQQIQVNSLLRLYAEPTALSKALDMLDNYEKIASVAFKRAQDFPEQMFKLLAQYLRIASGGKKIGKEKTIDQNYCVQSKDYYRRDNFKLLEKLQYQELKKKGLLMRIPINLVPDSELNDYIPSKRFASARSLTPRPSTISSAALKYTDIATKRQEHGMRKQKIRKLFGRLDTLSRSTNRFPVSPTLNSSRITNGFNRSNLSGARQTLRKQRSTVGTLRQKRSTIETLNNSNLRVEGLK